MAETKTDTVTPPATGSGNPRKDVVLCQKIVKALEENGNQRVLLVGEAGIGKTKMAKKVDEEATKEGGLCYQTIWLHLNKKFKVNEKYDPETMFEDEWTLYENIASQLCLHSDFEETEVGDRDEDEEEEKKVDELLNIMKQNIKNYLLGKKESAEKKLKDKLDEEKKLAEEKLKADNKAKNTPVKKAAEPENNKKQGQGEEKADEAAKTSGEGDSKDTPSERKPYLLLILDDEGIEGMTSEREVMGHLGLDDFLIDHKPRKLLITRRTANEEATKSGGETEEKNNSNSSDDQGGEPEIKEDKSESETTVKAEDIKRDEKASKKKESWGSTDTYWNVKFHETDESKALLESFDDKYLENLLTSVSELFPSSFLDYIQGTGETWLNRLVKKSKNLPAAVVVLAKSLDCTIKTTSFPDEELKLLKEKIEMVLSTERDIPLPSDEASSSEGAAIKPCNRDNPILRLAYELLKNGQWKDVILDCFWHSLDFFEHCGSVYYRDLITQWILEGYFDPVRSVEQAYQDGHDILMELIDRGLLKIQENNVVVPEMAMRIVADPRRRGHLGGSRLGFSRVYGGNKKKGIGKINVIDDMIKTVQATKGDKVTTILVSGDRLRRETPDKYFKKLGDLEVLGLFEPTLEPFVSSFSKLVKLRVLVIRDCDLLTGIEELKAFERLHALEVSGASSLKKISFDFFSGMKELQSLHLSGLQITSSPSSISELSELHCLIIRDCPLLEDLPDVQGLLKLEVVDVSGARGLQTCFDNTKGEKKNKSKNKNFYQLTKLQHLDFSESQIERLPIFQDSAVGAKLHSLTRLLLRNCSKLRRLPSLKPLSGLQILDLSGTTSLVEMLEVCYEDKPELKILNLTGSNLGELATTIEDLSNLTELLLKDCTNLDKIPNITKLKNLEVIDVSGCTKLETIEGSFEKMYYLREIDLTGTKVTTLPELPEKTRLVCEKRITLADTRSFKGKDWDEVKEKIESEKASSADAVVKSQEISEREPEGVEEIQSIEPQVSNCTDVSKERLVKVPIKRALYEKTLLSFDPASQEDFKYIHESKNLRGEAEANAKFVFCEYVDSTKLKSIFSKNKSVKDCSLRMCIDIKDLFSDVDEESLGSLETLSIFNFPSLETINWGGCLNNIKKLSVEGCPNIKTFFPTKLPNNQEVQPQVPNKPEVTQQSSNKKEVPIKKEVPVPQLPSSLEVLRIKNCEKLEKVVEGVELLTLTNLKVEMENCPNFKEDFVGRDWVMVNPI